MFLGGKKKIIFSCLIGFVLAAFFISFLFIVTAKTSPVFAQQGNFGLDQLNSDLPQTDLLTVVNKAIKIVLGLLGVIAVCLIIYAGFIWMTAGGDAKKIQKAKDIIANALIGMIIILFSYAITSFVISKLGEATGVNNGGGNGGGNDYYPLPSSQFQINNIETTHASGDNHQDVYRCSNIQTKFNYWVKKETVDTANSQGSLQIINTSDNSKIDGSWTTLSNVIIFKHPILWEANANYQAIFPKSISNTQIPPKFLLACAASGDCVNTDTAFLWNFSSGSENDTEAPEVTSAYPTADLLASNYPNQNVSRSPIIEVSFSEAVDATTIIQENTSPPHPIAGNIIIQELNGQNGTVVEILDNDVLEVDIKNQGFRLSFIDPNLLKAFTWYRITTQNITDLCNNVMESPKVWEFMTNDKVPGIQSQYPSGEKICPDTPISIVFNTTMFNNYVSISISANGNTLSATLLPAAITEPIYSISNSSGTFTIKDTAEVADNKFRVFEFIPNNPLSINTEYTVNITTDLKTGSSTNLSKTWNFTVASADTCVCSPYISHLSPNQGPKGQCLTVFGYCFEGTIQEPATPSITFDNISSGVEGFSDNYLTTTLPNNFIKGDNPLAQVTAAYSALGNLSSNLVDFYVDSDETANGPCLWSLNPVKGSQGQVVKLSGTRFGASKGLGDGVKFYSDIESAANSWSNSSINTTVPSGAADGNVTVITEEGESNGVPFDVNGGVGASCDGNINSNVCDPNNLSCDPGLICNISTCLCSEQGQGVCGDGTTNQPNSFNINEQCDDNNIISGDGCDSTCQLEGVGESCDGNEDTLVCEVNNSLCANQLYCDNTSCTCQPSPIEPVTVANSSPSGTNVCLNAAVSITFNQPMDKESFANNVILGKATAGGLGDIVKGTITSYEQLVNQNIQTVLTFMPDDLLDSTTPYQGIIKNGPGGVRGKNGGTMASVYNALVFTTGMEICKIDKVNITIAPSGTVKTNDLFGCAGKNNCPDDQNSTMSGNQHQYIAQAFSVAGNISTPLTAKYYWSQESKPAGLIAVSVNQTTDLANPYITSQNKNGQAIITVTAVSSGIGVIPNTKDAQVTVDTFLCENPWPSATDFPYQDVATNFSTFYCRDGQALLSDFDNKVDISGSNNVIKEFFFKVSGSRDVIGVRVMKNDQKLDPLAWYQENVPNPGSVSALIVDGYEAVRSGRTVYVNAANVAGEIVYANIYLISYNEEASSETIDIFNQMLKNWHFNTNISDFLIKKQLNRDLVRWGDEKEIEKLLENYKTIHGYYPKLESGSYIKGVTTSKWPSWQATLSRELGQPLPVDPINEFGACAGYNTETCWNEASKTFAGDIPTDFPLDTNVYFYRSLNEGQNYVLETQEEYGESCLENQCKENGVCYPQSSCHPAQLLVYCQQGVWKSYWKSSCGNGVPDCGELCDINPRNYCDLQFGVNGWHEPKFQSCLPPGSINQCKWNLQNVYAIEDCGGYCGDNIPNGAEQCDSNSRNYCDAVLGNHNWYSEPKNQSCLPSGNVNQCKWNPQEVYTASACGGYCGDGATNGLEQCDSNFRNYCDEVLGQHNWYSEPKNQSCFPAGNTNQCQWNPDQTYTVADCGGYCGDGNVDSDFGEECEQAGTGTSDNDQYACTSNCEWSGGWCGNTDVNSIFGETCDLGSQNGIECNASYGSSCQYCNNSCITTTKLGEYCGDGVKNGTEECDGTLCCTASCQQETALTRYVLGNTTIYDYRGRGNCDQNSYLECPSYYTRLMDVIAQVNIKEICCWSDNPSHIAAALAWEGPIYALPNYSVAMYSSSCVPNIQCAPYYCGDNEIEGPEQCEQAGTGTSVNDQYACTSDCKWLGGYCGDGILNGLEQCDGTLCCTASCQQKAILTTYYLGLTTLTEAPVNDLGCIANSYKTCPVGYTRVIASQQGWCQVLRGEYLGENMMWPIYDANCVPDNQCTP